MMLTSSTKSITPITTGEGGRRVVIFTVKLPRGQPLSPAFTNLAIITVLEYEHTAVEPVVVQ